MSCRTVKIENQYDYESTIKGNLVEMLKPSNMPTTIDVIKAFVNMKIDYLK